MDDSTSTVGNRSQPDLFRDVAPRCASKDQKTALDFPRAS